MLDIMSQAKNAIDAYNVALKATASNIGGMNVTGYKRLDVSFQTIFEKVLSRGTAASGNLGGTNPRQYGQGMGLSDVSLDFSAGEYASGANIDLAIQGQGLFIVSPDGGDSYLYTRAGNFEVDASGNLLSNGMQVYGFNASGSQVPIRNLPSGNKNNYWWADGSIIDPNTGNPFEIGTLTYTTDGVNFTSTGYRIALTYFPNPNGLAQARGTSFAATPASGEAATPQLPGGAVGSIRPGQVENSNVFYLGETIDALELQRAMSGNLTMVRMASDMISQFINKLS
jgi:flagellar hook protein FlgE